MMHVYIAGPITGIKNFNVPFEIAENELISKGHKVMNPAKLPSGFTQADYMRICLSMIDACDTVVLLNGWTSSEGALVEKAYAKKTGKVILRACDMLEMEGDD